MEWSVCCTTVVFAAMLFSPMVEGQHDRPTNTTGHIVPKGGVRDAGDCLEEGYHTIAVGQTVCVSSPNYPGRYPNHASSLWQLDHADQDSTLEVDCPTFKVQRSRGCKQDFLRVMHDGADESYCGRDAPGSFETTSYWMDLYFQSNRRKTNKGFICYITAVGDGTVTTEGPVVTTAAPGPTQAPNPNCQCGLTNPSRIVGGSNTEPNEYPWLVGLTSNNNNNKPFCGGSVYNSEWIITAAHCVDGTSASSIKVVLGMHNYANNLPTPTTRTVTQIISHASYNSRTLDNDIALIKMSSAVNLDGSAIRPVCIPTASADYAGQMATVTGWGTLSSGGNQPNMNHDVQVPIRTKAECIASYGAGEITNNMICAGTPQFTTDSCQGDSGGPLTVPVNNHHFLAGIVSWGYGCAKDPYYGVYTDVPNYISWISQRAGSPTCTP